ncbi:hypothetical protein JANAI62_28270 [Jannaschia pagri]|uniref:DUF2726 domain-containing protein n=1 Tax=Jannaschia pagri TaxID=2829797 RepID=A0ABQ4NP80_9RHOB|nr:MULTISPECIES: DUF2726 domain-containing protein [unclassified Jannaschia]GIT92369.1 hypothetical protein JANAI61_28270 [Jannaschia sp. AI_61]GIT96204.1 hypothetical protein JANAI62_28270 [Jannaschia sp. AI_62]
MIDMILFPNLSNLAHLFTDLVPLVIIGCGILLCGLVVMGKPATAPRRRATQPPKQDARPEKQPTLDPTRQASLEKLKQCEVTARPLMSRPQTSLGRQLRMFADQNGLVVHGETALSAIVTVRHGDRSMSQAGFNAISRKRVDFCLTDRAMRPVCVVEYHGSGHRMKGAAEAERRDHTKRIALAMASVPLIEVVAGTDWNLVEKQLLTQLEYARTADDYARAALS